ncbi:hypothetical protein QJS10_CPB11g00560 [Acorus calamus]|uniref:START domain-containing protein n=1 Tax=Acorus calamus TaxID=4465 RepID=A0AAV9DSG1_ACOCL|nr:hypothetical protein QJS10_CPB11g00560 [Acorus calamus]
MGVISSVLFEILNKPSFGDVLGELALISVPVWVAILVGLLVGWAWKPKWATTLVGGDDIGDPTVTQAPAPAEEASSGFGLMSGFSSLKSQWPGCMIFDVGTGKETTDCGSSRESEREKLAVTEEDLEHLCQLVEVRDGGPTWLHMMDRTLPTMGYQAWRRDPEVGPPQYRSRTVFEDVTPELVRDFFWDDEFRSKWDDMLIHSATLEECPTTGTMIVHWIRKFPFFCSDREYTIGRRIWETGRSYYCITKGVPCPSVPRRSKPRRVDLYYSSWCIRAVESRRGDGQLTACEVLLFHHEDMGIPWEIAKLGVRQGMWGAVKKIEPGLRAYQMARQSGAPLSRCAYMAQINNKINPDYLMSLESTGDSSEIIDAEEDKPWGVPKILVVGTAVALACSLDRGLLTKAVIFGVARRFAKLGRRL